MNKLGEKSLKTLEYYEILEKLAGQAASQAAKEKCRALRPLDDHEQAELWLQQTTDAKDLMVRQGSPAFGGIREVGAILSRADRGGTLNPRELLAVASLLQTARRALLYDAEHETKTTLTPVFGLLSGNRDLEESITTAIISEEEIADGASPELLSIRRELRRVSGKVRETLNRMISGERSKYLQENIITQRNGRFVVPVKVEHRGDVPGLVHDTSSTGATVFVEPQQVVEINNQIKVLEGREENEIERILAELSSRVSMYKGAIEQDYDALTTLDFIFARAKLSFDMNACAPVLVEDGSRCKLLRARHPLLDKDKAVPIDIAIGYDYDTLVITGPNTGGKTVSLKTLGLLSLMAASQMGACVAATTHYAELKTFALTTDGVENASCEFDVKSLQPTYRLLTGIPGKSNAFAIAARLGLQPTIIERAKEQVSTEDARFEDVLAELERERRRVEQMKEEAQRMRSAAQSERDKMRAERDAAEDRVDKMMESARGQADNILKNARMTAETVFDELETLKKKAQKKNADQNLAAAKAALRGVITQTENEQRRGIQKRVVEADEIRSVQKGDRVRLLNVGGVIATVLAPADRDGSVQVQAGPMKMTVKENELRLVEEKKNAPKPKPQPRRDAPRRELNIRSAESEVDVRGMSAEEALFEVDNFLSRAIMAGLPSVTVIHGKGTGVLRTAVQQHLRKNKRVKSVRSGVYGEGEQGVTIVELR